MFSVYTPTQVTYYKSDYDNGMMQVNAHRFGSDYNFDVEDVSRNDLTSAGEKIAKQILEKARNKELPSLTWPNSIRSLIVCVYTWPICKLCDLCYSFTLL